MKIVISETDKPALSALLALFGERKNKPALYGILLRDKDINIRIHLELISLTPISVRDIPEEINIKMIISE
jgi:hypothetical protein